MNPWVLWAMLPIVITAAYAGVSAAPWVPTRRRELKLLVDTMPDPKDGLVVDLGSGTGTILFAIARRYPSARCVGYEISLLPWFVSWVRKCCAPRRYRRVSFRLKSLYYADLKNAAVVTCFLLPDSYKKVIPALKGCMNPAGLLAVEGWELPGVPMLREDKASEALSIYWYEGKSLT